MAINIIQGYNPSTTEPLDSRVTVANQTARLSFDSFNIYEGMVVYQRDTNELYVLTDTSLWNNSSGWTLIGAGSTFPYSGSAVITGSLLVSGSNGVRITGSSSTQLTGSELFLIKGNSNNTILSVSSSGNTELYSNLLIIKNFTSQQPVLTVSQSIVQFATQSADPTGTTIAGSIWFTSASFYVGLEDT